MHFSATFPAWVVMGLGLFAMATSSGCQSARVERPLTAMPSSPEMTRATEFWHTLADRPVVCNDEAMHALLLYVNGEDAATTYGQRVSEMRKRGLLGNRFDQPAEQAVERGTVAMAAARILGLKGGVTMRVFGPLPR